MERRATSIINVDRSIEELPARKSTKQIDRCERVRKQQAGGKNKPETRESEPASQPYSNGDRASGSQSSSSYRRKMREDTDTNVTHAWRNWVVSCNSVRVQWRTNVILSVCLCVCAVCVPPPTNPTRRWGSKKTPRDLQLRHLPPHDDSLCVLRAPPTTHYLLPTPTNFLLAFRWACEKSFGRGCPRSDWGIWLGTSGSWRGGWVTSVLR